MTIHKIDDSRVSQILTDYHRTAAVGLEKKERGRGWYGVPLRSLDGRGGSEGLRYEGRYSDFRWTQLAPLALDSIDLMNEIRVGVVSERPNLEAVGLMRFLLLKPGGRVGRHADSFRGETLRIHVVLQSGPRCKMEYGKTNLYLPPGTVFYMDVSRPHSVENLGTEDRVHLVFDLGEPTTTYLQPPHAPKA